MLIDNIFFNLGVDIHLTYIVLHWYCLFLFLLIFFLNLSKLFMWNNFFLNNIKRTLKVLFFDFGSDFLNFVSQRSIRFHDIKISLDLKSKVELTDVN